MEEKEEIMIDPYGENYRICTYCGDVFIAHLEMLVISRGRPLIFSHAELQLWMKLGKPMVVEMDLLRRKEEI